MSGALFVGLWLMVGVVPVPEVSAPTEPPRPQRLEAGGGIAVSSGGRGLSSLVVLAFEKPVLVSQAFFVGFTAKAEWRHQGSNQSSQDGIDALVGLRFGVVLGSAFEVFFAFGAGVGFGWARTSETFHGWWLHDQFGLGFQAGLGARIRVGERVSLVIVPAELLGGFWPLGGWVGNLVTADFTAYAGLSVSL